MHSTLSASAALAILSYTRSALADCTFEHTDTTGDLRSNDPKRISPYLDCPDNCDFDAYLAGLEFNRYLNTTDDHDSDEAKRIWGWIEDANNDDRFFPDSADFNETVIIPLRTELPDGIDAGEDGLGFFTWDAWVTCIEGRLTDCDDDEYEGWGVEACGFALEDGWIENGENYDPSKQKYHGSWGWAKHNGNEDDISEEQWEDRALPEYAEIAEDAGYDLSNFDEEGAGVALGGNMFAALGLGLGCAMLML